LGLRPAGASIKGGRDADAVFAEYGTLIVLRFSTIGSCKVQTHAGPQSVDPGSSR
jgi:hypothetical protein